MKKDRRHFAVLGVTPADDMTTIRMAWRAKVRSLHPDRARNRAVATAALAEVNAAFDALQGHVPEPEVQKKAVRLAPKADRARDTSELVRPVRPAAGERLKANTPSAGLSRDLRKLSERAREGYARARQFVRAA